MNQVVYRLTNAITKALERPVRVVAENPERNSVEVAVPSNRFEHPLHLIWAGEGWPADVSAVLGQVPAPWPPECVVVARHLSPGSMRLLAEREANWLDESGGAHIEGPDGFLVIRDPKRKDDHDDDRKAFRWSSSSLDIGELLLSEPMDEINAMHLAQRTGWSHAQTTSVLRGFDKEGWTEKSGAERGPTGVRQLVAPADLLDAWAASVVRQDRKPVLAHRVLRDPMDFLRRELGPALAESTEWAATGWAGLEAIAPFVTSVPVIHVYVPLEVLVDGRLRDVMQAAGLREVDEGARIEFWSGSPLTLSLAEGPGGLPVVSAPRLYADLRSLGGRAEEGAQHVREERIGF